MEFTQETLQEVGVALQDPQTQGLLQKIAVEFHYTPDKGNILIFILKNIGDTYAQLQEAIKVSKFLADSQANVDDIQQKMEQVKNGEISVDDLSITG